MYVAVAILVIVAVVGFIYNWNHLDKLTDCGVRQSDNRTIKPF